MGNNFMRQQRRSGDLEAETGEPLGQEEASNTGELMDGVKSSMEGTTVDKRGWNCSKCGFDQTIKRDMCDNCGHARNKEPESADQIIPNWNPHQNLMATDAHFSGHEMEGVANDDSDGEEEVNMFEPEGNRELVENLRSEVAASKGLTGYEDGHFSDEFVCDLKMDDEKEERRAMFPLEGHGDLAENSCSEVAGTEGLTDYGDRDFSDDDDDDGWDEFTFDEVVPIIPKYDDSENWQPSAGRNEHWRCSLCDQANPIRLLKCQSCDRVTDFMRDDGEDLVAVGRVEVTAGERPAPCAGQKVWQCSECQFCNDHVEGNKTCENCSHVARKAGEFVVFMMEPDEYEQMLIGRHKWSSNSNSNLKPSMLVSDDFTRVPKVAARYVHPTRYAVAANVATTNPLANECGMPRPLPCVDETKEEYWRDGAIICPSLQVDGARQNGSNECGFAVNEQGWLAFVAKPVLRIFAPVGPSFSFVCEIGFDVPSADHPLRVRYDGDIVYIFIQYKIFRFVVDTASGTITQLDAFADAYMKKQNFRDMDVRDGFVVTTWKKWVGFYRAAGFEWFHAVSTACDVQPKSLVWKRSYVHLWMGSCIVAFHCASKSRAVLWVAGNLPKSDTSFCVSDHYGVFVLANGQVVQSYYDALTAQSICSAVCGGVTPAPKNDYNPAGHVVFGEEKGDEDGSPFANVEHIEFDESFGTKGRLLCWDGHSGQMKMVLNRGELAELEMLFSEHFLRLRERVGANLIQLVGKENEEELRRVYDKFCALYSERLIQWFLRGVVGIHVYTSDGLVVFSALNRGQVD